MTEITMQEVIKQLNRKGFLVGRPQPDGTMLYGWTVRAAMHGIIESNEKPWVREEGKSRELSEYDD